MNRLLVVKTKHDTQYFDASTDELLAAACYIVIKSNMAQHFYDVYDVSEKDLTAAAWTDEFIESFPKELREQAETLRTYGKQAIADREKQIADREEAERILAVGPEVVPPKDPKKMSTPHQRVPAYRLLWSRATFEYEGVELVKVINGLEFVEEVKAS